MKYFSKQLKKWRNGFSRQYTDRTSLFLKDLNESYNKKYSLTLTEMNKMFLDRINRDIGILEVDSNIGNQLVCLQNKGFNNLYGMEPQTYGVELFKKKTKHINIIHSSAFDTLF